jgi:hypothetical protein
VDSFGAAFLLHGDTPWSLVSSLSDAEVDEYIDDRAAKGFTALLIEAPVFHFTPDGSPNNVDGAAPFTSMSGNWNWVLNNAYWTRVDRAVNRCKANGIAVLLNPAYLGYPGFSEGCEAEVSGSSDGTLQAYGAALAARYTQRNVIWCLGGDQDPNSTLRAKQWQIVTGIRSVRTTDIITAHGFPGSPGYSVWNGQTGFNLNTAYPDVTDATYTECATEYARSGPLPFIMLEHVYEQERGTPISAAGLRRQSYQALLSGACGQFFGNNPIWHFESPNRPYSYTGTWESNLDSTGSVQQQYVKQLFSAFEWWKLAPVTDTSFVTGSLSSGDSRICPAVAGDGSFALCWVPSSQTVNFNTNALTGIPGNVRIRLYDASAGTYSTAHGSVAKTSSQNVATGGERVVVFDAAAASLFSWADNGADSYDVGWDTITHAAGDRNDPTLYPNRESVGAGTSWTNEEGVAVYAAVRSVVDGEVGPWSSETTLSA